MYLPIFEDKHFNDICFMVFVFIMMGLYSSSAFAVVVLDDPYRTFNADMDNAESGAIYTPSQTSSLPLMTRMEYARGRYFQALYGQYLSNASASAKSTISTLKSIHDGVKMVLDVVSLSKAGIGGFKSFQAERDQAVAIFSRSNASQNFVKRYATREQAAKAMGGIIWVLQQQSGNAAFQALSAQLMDPRSAVSDAAFAKVANSAADPLLTGVIAGANKIVLDSAAAYAGEIGFNFAKWGAKVKPPSLFSIVMDGLNIINDLSAASALSGLTQSQYDKMLALEFLKHYYLGFRGNRQLFDAALGKPATTALGKPVIWSLKQSLTSFLDAKTAFGGSFAQQYGAKNMFSLGSGVRPDKVLAIITTILENNPWLGARPALAPAKTYSKYRSPTLVGERYTLSLASDALLSGHTWSFKSAPVLTPVGASPVTTTGFDTFQVNSVGDFGVSFNIQWQKNTAKGVVTSTRPLEVSFNETAQLLDTQVTASTPTVSISKVLGARQLEISLRYSSLMSANAGATVYSFNATAASPMRLQFMEGNSQFAASTPTDITQSAMPLQVKMIVGLSRSQGQKLQDGLPINFILKMQFINPTGLYHKDPNVLFLTGSTQRLERASTFTIVTKNLAGVSALPSIIYRVRDTTISNFDSWTNTVDLKKGDPFEICFVNSVNLTAFSAVRVHYYVSPATVSGQQGWITGSIANGCATFAIPNNGNYFFDYLNEAATPAFPKGKLITALTDNIRIKSIASTPQSGTVPGVGTGGAGTAPPPAGGVTVVAGIPTVSFTDLPGGIRLFHTPRFTKLDSAGKDLPKSAAAWSCVRDNANGRVWEVKNTTPSSLRNQSNVYIWYNPDPLSNGGNAGTAATVPACSTGGSCDTQKYTAAVNVVGLCGFNDWRLPKYGELSSIVDRSIANPGPTIDTAYFPNTINLRYWSASPYAGSAPGAWYVGFGSGSDGVNGKANSDYVRLVRGGQ